LRLQAAGLPLDELAHALAEKVRALVDADGALVTLSAPPLAASSGLSRAQAARLRERSGAPERAGDDNGASIVVAPILSLGERIGYLAALAHRRHAFSTADEEVLAFIARSLVSDLEAARLFRLATTDPETGAGNRQLLAERLPEEVERARRLGGRELALVRVVVPDWTRLCELHGQLRAAAALRELTRRVRAALRTIDWVARLEDDVLVCVLPGAGETGAHRAAAGVIARVEGAPIALPGGGTVSLAVRCAAVTLQGGMDEAALLDAAERADPAG